MADEYIGREFNPCDVCDYKRCSNCILHELAMKFVGHPAADVAPVVHGAWVWDVETHGDPMYGVDVDFGYRCSECKVWADEYGVDGDIYEEPPTHILHYCPHCGARMDGAG